MELGKGCKCLVTGGAGFIGSHICEALLEKGCQVVSFDDYSAGKTVNHEHIKDNPNFLAIHGDVTNQYAVDTWVKDVDVIFHNAASKKNICLKDPRRDLEVNAKGTFNILESAKRFGVKKIVHASTGSVYGEAQFLPQSESHPLEPCSYYGVSKLAGESYCKTFSKLYDMDITILRYFHVYGARQESGEFGGVIAIFLEKIRKGEPITIFGDGTQERSFTYVKDVVNANLQSVNYKRGIFNCASGIAVKLYDVALEIMRVVGKEVPILYKDWQVGDIKKFEIDNTLIKKKLGITFLTDLKKGIYDTANYS